MATWTLRRGWWLISLALFAPGGAFLIEGILDPRKRTDDGMSFRVFGTVWLGMMLLLHAGLFGYLHLRNRRAAWLERHGLPATAVILAAEFTGTEVNLMPEIELELEVALPGEAPYRVRHACCMSPLSSAALQAGARVKVLVDPRDRKKIMLDA